jgi:putative transposase
VPRRPRVYEPNGIYHLTCHGVGAQSIFIYDQDRFRFLSRLDSVTRRSAWRCLAFCLMTTHYHLVIQVRETNLSTGMHWLNGGYARDFNTRHGRRGHVFEARFADRPIADDSHLLDAIRYVALNPVRAGLVRRPEDWPWGSYGALVGERRDWSFVASAWVLSLFSPRRADAIRLLHRFVAEDANQVPGTESVPGTGC